VRLRSSQYRADVVPEGLRSAATPISVSRVHAASEAGARRSSRFTMSARACDHV
jgi:hypothetical protein